MPGPLKHLFPVQVLVVVPGVLRLLPGGITGMDPLCSMDWMNESASCSLPVIT